MPMDWQHSLPNHRVRVKPRPRRESRRGRRRCGGEAARRITSVLANTRDTVTVTVRGGPGLMRDKASSGIFKFVVSVSPISCLFISCLFGGPAPAGAPPAARGPCVGLPKPAVSYGGNLGRLSDSKSFDVTDVLLSVAMPGCHSPPGSCRPFQLVARLSSCCAASRWEFLRMRGRRINFKSARPVDIGRRRKRDHVQVSGAGSRAVANPWRIRVGILADAGPHQIRSARGNVI